MRYLLFLTLFISLFFANGCTRLVDLSQHPDPSPELIVKAVKDANKKLISVESEFIMKLKHENLKFSLFGEYKLDQDRNFAGRLKGPFGMFAGKIIIADEMYEIQLGRGEIVNGPVDSLNFQDLTGLPLPDVDPVTIFYPQPLVIISDIIEETFSVDDEENLWTWEQIFTDGQKIIVFDAAKGVIISETWVSETGEILLSKEYDFYSWHKGTQLASWIKVDSPPGGTSSVEIEVKYFKVNKKWKDNPFEFISGDAL